MKDLKGTKTEANLWEAFAGESATEEVAYCEVIIFQCGKVLWKTIVYLTFRNCVVEQVNRWMQKRSDHITVQSTGKTSNTNWQKTYSQENEKYTWYTKEWVY